MAARIFFLIVFSLSFCFGQQNSEANPVKLNDFKEILPDEWVSAVIEDKNGFIWAATQDGLYKHNGKNFKIYRYEPHKANTLPANWVKSIGQDSDGTIWVGTYGGGLVKFNEKKERFDKVKLSTKDSTYNPKIIYDIFITSTSAIWLASDDGIFRKSKSDSLFNRFKNSQTPVRILELSNGTELIAHDEKLSKYNSKDKRLTTIIDEISLDQIVRTHKNEIIYRSNDDLYLYDFKTKPKRLKLPNSDSAIFITIDKDGKYVIIGSLGVYQFNTETKSFQAYPDNLMRFTRFGISKIFKDSQNLFWVATHKGLFKESLLNQVFTGHFNIHARRILTDSSYIYIGGRQGFHKILKEGESGYERFLKNKKITALCKTSLGIWAADHLGNVHFIDHSNKIKTVKLTTSEENIVSMYGMVTDANGFVWVSSRNRLFVLNDKGVLVNTYIIDKTKEIKVIRLIIDRLDNLWGITVGDGIYKISKISDLDKSNNEISYTKYIHREGNPETINSDVVTDIHMSANGNIWIGTDSGLNMYNAMKDNFIPLKINGQLFDKKVMAIQTDNKNLLWISTINSGLYVYNENNETLFNLSENDGLISNACLYTSSDSDDNTLYFGTDEGVQIVDASLFNYPKVEKSPDFSKVKALGSFSETFHPLESEKPISLTHNQNSLNISLELADYRFPTKINYYYKLNEETVFWTKIDGDIINLNNLKYGNYNLLAKAAYQATDNAPLATLAFRINPPWYRSTLAYFVFFLAILTVLIYFFQLHYKQKLASNKLKAAKELDRLKSNLFTNISHELRTPLTLISGPVEHQLSKDNLNSVDREELHLVKQNTDRLLNLVNQLMDLALIDSGQLKLKIKEGNLNLLLKQTVNVFQYQSKKKNINISATINNLEWVWFDKDSLEKIVFNLLSNAIKYAIPNSTITFSANQKNSMLLLSVMNASNIDNKNIDQFFQRFYQNDASTEGVGVGLALVKELVVLHKGTVLANKIGTNKIQFTVTLPIYKSAFSSFDVSENEIKTNLQENDEDNGINDDTVILVIEDNDEIRKFICSILKNQFKIIEAGNGQIGYNLAIKYVPDLIISDVMMPVMGGLILSKKLKSSQLTSHIPIILLTAKVGEESEIEGLKVGVDAYITKPFSTEKLKTRVEKLLEGRKQLQEFYGNSFETNVDIEVTSVEADFLKSLQSVMDNNLTSTEFTSERFADLMHISRAQLHRKLKAIFGKSTSEFIRHERLKLAKNLLKKSDITVSEIAYQVGFNSPSYFIKCFKELYNCTPNEVNKS